VFYIYIGIFFVTNNPTFPNLTLRENCKRNGTWIVASDKDASNTLAVTVKLESEDFFDTGLRL